VNFNGWLVRFLLLTDQWDVSAYEAHILEAARRGHRVLKHVYAQEVPLCSRTLEAVFELLRKSLPASTNIVLLIDELTKYSYIGPLFPYAIRNCICELQDTAGVVAIFSTLANKAIADRIRTTDQASH
jgi:hypothetical protein